MYHDVHNPTPSLIVWRYYREALSARAIKKDAFGHDVCQAYVDGTPAEHRHIHVAIGNDAATMAANGQMVYRMLNPEETARSHQLRADFMPFVVSALPEPYRSNCTRDLLRPFGVMPIRIPDASEAGTYRGIGCVMKETGEFIHLGASDPQTDAELDKAIREGEEAAAAILSHIEALKAKKRQKQPAPALKVAK